MAVVAGGAAAAADDEDGAGGVDHGRVRRSRSPFRVGCAAHPADTCGQRVRAWPVAPNATTRTWPQRAKTQSDGNAQTHAHIRWKRANTHMRSLRHTYTHGHARTHTSEHKHANEHMRKRTRGLHAHAHARAPETPVEDPVHLRYPLVPPRYPLVSLGNPVRTPPYRVGTASVPRARSAEYPPSRKNYIPLPLSTPMVPYCTREYPP